VRLQQFLAELHYLPVTFAPPREKAAKALSDESTNASLVSYVPRAGSFAPTYANTPEQLISLFKPGVWNVLDKSAIISFETVHNLPVDGIPSGRVWGAVAAAVAARQVDPSPYNYLLVSETLPERLNVWSNGVVVFSTLANTGAPGAATPVGTWPVWLRFVSTTMAGTNPNGSKYDDPDIPDVSYFYGSDAVHGFVRASYGFPQSDGCVELPLAAATTVYRYDPIGTLVTVTTGVLHA
jgi:lipoprotein-anchoring transpeptidase ErfK/SrfK